MPQGFLYSAVEAAIKKPGRLDLALIYSERPSQSAAVFTTNSVKAWPVILTQERAAQGRLQAVVANSGNANACTGPIGREHAARMTELVAQGLGLDPELIGVCSTGVIGRPMPIERIEAVAPALVQGLSPDGADRVARAIMTTDTRPKKVELTLDLEGTPAKLLGLAKGSGMIHPNMATMLVFLMTDAQVTATALKGALQDALPTSFHAITVDGDTSTNDSVILMANGAAGGPEIHGVFTPAGRTFSAAVEQVCRELAQMLVADAEGGTKAVTIRVKGAQTEMEADMVALSVALSPLCKTAFFGGDPNWGRIICAVGYSGARIEPDEVDIFFDDQAVCLNGAAVGGGAVAAAEEVMRRPSFTVTIDLKQGQAEKSFTTSDLSYDYVKINAEYTT